MRSFIFGHVLYAASPSTGVDLVNDIVLVATDLPGYTDHCNHQHEIKKRATDWAWCVEDSRYYGKAAAGG